MPLAGLRESAVKLDNKRAYVVYSTSGRRSTAGAFLLSKLGFTAYVLDGGLLANRELAQGTVRGTAGHRSRDPRDPRPRY